MRSFRGCRLRWHFASLLRSSWEPTIPNKHLWTGTLGHHALAGFYSAPPGTRAEAMERARKAWVKREVARLRQLAMTKSNWDEVKESILLSRGMLRHYALWAASYDDFDMVLPETMLAVELPDLGENVRFVGTADGLIRDVYGKHWLIEHKTAARTPNPDALRMDEQSLAYTWAAKNDPKIASYEVQGTLFNILRKKIPTVPRRLRAGGLSQSLNIDTTYEVYLQELTRYGFPTTLYGRVLRELRERGNTFFFRTYVRHDQQTLETFGRYMRLVAREMLDPEVTIWPHRTWWCESSCPYKEPCEAALSGLDPTPLLVSGFRRRTAAPFDFEEDER
ncbi:MAG: PD-(D/E)XK nuclease family protein [Candidatus Bathyarchaeota archaeon]|nr:PD-(D/E)XK nuclease family protein [Candidatus Bathyarchaeota archaeon]